MRSPTPTVFNPERLDIAQIDEEIARSYERIRHLRALRNTLVPVARLPDELLLKIIFAHRSQHEADIVQQFGDDEYFPTLSYSWLSITHVCHHWRMVALECPNLWTKMYIRNNHSNWLDDFIQRSQSAPISLLSLDTPFTGGMNPDYVSRFLCKDGIGRPIERFRASLFKGFKPQKTFAQSDFLPSVVEGHLKEFVLWDNEPSAEISRIIVPFVASCSESFRLEVLSLRSSTWDKRLLQDTLVTLQLGGTISGMRWDEFFVSLDSMKNLQHLRLEEVLHQLRPAAFSYEHATISLWRLQLLVIASSGIEDCARFLKGVTIPSTTRVSIGLSGDRVEHLVELLATFPQTISRNPLLQEFHLFRLEVNDTSWDINTIRSMGIALDHSALATADNIDSLQYHIRYYFDTENMGPIETLTTSITQFLRSFPTTNIQHFELSGQTFHLFGPFLSAFSTSQTISTLHIEERTAVGHPSILRTLTSFLPTCSCLRKNIRKYPIRHLRRLACSSCRSFSQTFFPKLRFLEYEQPAWDQHDLSNSQITMLKQFLLFCALGRHKIKRLELRNWGTRFKSRAVVDLGRLCGEVVWVGSSDK
ncbi:hypothetical protein AX16_006703 [Volvariella volvacea WC 439]|nr:hypothetical protein AX16_006703 [Volvariella volvacea WC 439]